MVINKIPNKIVNNNQPKPFYHIHFSLLKSKCQFCSERIDEFVHIKKKHIQSM